MSLSDRSLWWKDFFALFLFAPKCRRTVLVWHKAPDRPDKFCPYALVYRANRRRPILAYYTEGVWWDNCHCGHKLDDVLLWAVIEPPK